MYAIASMCKYVINKNIFANNHFTVISAPSEPIGVFKTRLLASSI